MQNKHGQTALHLALLMGFDISELCMLLDLHVVNLADYEVIM